MKRITDFFVCVADCPFCLGEGAVCESHPLQAWGDGMGLNVDGACYCGAPGMPCRPENRGG